MDYTVRYSRFCSLHCSQHRGNSFSGVDAAPAAIVGAALVSLGIESGSEAAMQYVPVIAFLTGIWLAAVLFFKSRKNRGLHFDTGDGRIYQRDCTDNYSDADTEDPWREGRIWRTSGTAQAYRRDVQRNQLAVSGTWCGSVAAASHGRKVIPKFPAAIVIMAAGVAATDVLSCRRTMAWYFWMRWKKDFRSWYISILRELT